jgi:signal transduction histidine kinase
MEDPATGRELAWLVMNPLVSVLLPVVAAFAGPAALRSYGRWTRRWLGPRDNVRASRVNRHIERVNRHIEAFGHQIALFILSLVLFVMAIPVIITVLLPVGPVVVVGARKFTGIFRQSVTSWTGIQIASPYLPPPPFPVPRADGLYQRGKQLYETPWWPALVDRIRWVQRDRATWRDLAAAVVIPVVLALLMLPSWLLVGAAFFWLPFTELDPWLVVPAGVVLCVLGFALSPGLVRAQARFAGMLLGPTKASRLAQRVSRLERTRTDATDAQAEELRRIERDLHDGIQSRLVAMGMKLGAVEALIDGDPAAAKKLTAELRQASSTALTELRELVRGIQPPVLSERGLVDAVRAVALDSPLKVEVTVEFDGRVEYPVETCVYFAVCELLANAVKHGEAQRASIELSHDGGALRVLVTDDGKGGANPARGTGLRGIERRLGAFDGKLTLVSPPGGATRATMEIPCLLD